MKRNLLLKVASPVEIIYLISHVHITSFVIRLFIYLKFKNLSNNSVINHLQTQIKLLLKNIQFVPRNKHPVFVVKETKYNIYIYIYITSSQNTTKFIALCCTICYTTTCFGLFKPSSGCIRLALRVMYPQGTLHIRLALRVMYPEGTLLSRLSGYKLKMA